MYRCSKCHSIKYCSRKCQKLHWPQHKLHCEHMKQEALQKKYIEKVESVIDMEDLCRIVIATDEKNATECRCTECSNLCTVIPGNYSPWQFDDLSKRAEMFENCLEAYTFGSETKPEDVVLYLRPKQVQEIKKTRADTHMAGNCVYLGPNGCKIKNRKHGFKCPVIHSFLRIHHSCSLHLA